MTETSDRDDQSCEYSILSNVFTITMIIIVGKEYPLVKVVSMVY